MFFWVEDSPEHQAVGRGGHAGDTPVFFLEHGADLFGWKFAQACLHERADYPTTHFVEEAVSFDNERQQAAGFSDIAAGEGAHGGFLLIPGIGGKGLKVMTTDEEMCASAQGSDIQRARDMPGGVTEQRIHGRVIPNEVTILLGLGFEAGMEVFGYRRCSHNANVVRQPGVEGQSEFADGHGAFGAGDFEVGDHAQGMNAGVGSAGAVDPGAGGKEFGERSFDFLLHPSANLLDLPTLVVRAVVGDGQFEFKGGRRSVGR